MEPVENVKYDIDVSPVKRPTHMVEVLEHQPNLITAIEQGLDELDKRLHTILRFEEEDRNPPRIELNEVSLVPLAQEIHTQNNRLERIRTHLVDILDRLEL